MFTSLLKEMVISAVVLVSLATNGLVQTDKDDFERLFTTPRYPVNGNVLVANDGKIIFEESYGYSDAGKKMFNHTASRFQLGSVTKTITSTAILQLKDQGELKLDDKFIKFFADFPFPEITIRQLLSHTSGLPDFQIFEELVVANPEKRFVNQDIIPALRKWKQDLVAPGEKWSYSNPGYCLLAMLVEKLSGNDFETYVHQHIFLPAGMTASYFESEKLEKPDSDKSQEQAYLHLYDSELQAVEVADWRAFVGNGGMISAASDLLKFDQALSCGKLLKLETLEEAQCPAKLSDGSHAKTDVLESSYGLGWFVIEDENASRIVWHGGGRPGVVVAFLRNVTKKHTVVVLDNSYNTAVYRLGMSAIRLLDGKKPTSLPRKSLVHDYGRALVKNGVDEAFCRLVELKSDSSKYYLDEEEMNGLAYQLLYEASFAKHTELALEVARLNAALFPESFNVYDTYGEILAKAGKKGAAILMYQKSIELNPDNEDGKRALQSLNR